MFFAAAEAQTYHRRGVKLRFFSSCFEYQDLFVGSRIAHPSESYLSRKVMSEVSVSWRRRSPSARSALPLKASLAQLKRTLGRSAMSRSWRQRCERGQRRSWLEKKLRQPEPGWVVHWRNQPWSQAAEAMSRAGVLGGHLAEATERPVQPSTRARFLEETLATMAQAQF
jgi:hypothetical protein